MSPDALKEYLVHGPFSVSRDEDGKFSAGRADDYTEVANKYGCYVYATRFGGSFRPWYAGRTKRSFNQEIFTPHKQQKLENIWDRFERGELVVFLVAPQAGPGRPNLKFVREMEKYLISACFEMNPLIENIQGLPRAAWQIAGVTSRRVGRPSDDAAAKMRTMLGF